MSLEEKIRSFHRSGKSRTVTAQLLGLSMYRLQLLVDAMDIDWPKRVTGRITLDGITTTWAKHAERLGIPEGTLRWRYRPGRVPSTKKGSITVEEVTKFLEMREKRIPASTAADMMGRSYNQLHARAKELLPDYRTRLTKIPRTRRTQAEIAAHKKEFLSSKRATPHEKASA